MKHVCREVSSVASVKGVDIDAERLFEKSFSVAKKTAFNRSSMLQDIMKAKKILVKALSFLPVDGYILPS